MDVEEDAEDEDDVEACRSCTCRCSTFCGGCGCGEQRKLPRRAREVATAQTRASARNIPLMMVVLFAFYDAF